MELLTASLIQFLCSSALLSADWQLVWRLAQAQVQVQSFGPDSRWSITLHEKSAYLTVMLGAISDYGLDPLISREWQMVRF